MTSSPPLVRRIAMLVAAAAAAACGATGQHAAAPIAAPAVPERFAYGPSSASYLIASHTAVEQDFGGQVSRNDIAMRIFLSVNTTADDSLAHLTMTVDSIPQYEGLGAAQGIAADIVKQAAGATFSGHLSPDGSVLGLTASDTSNILLQQLRITFERFFPRVPAGGVAAGQAWSDSSETKSSQGGFDLVVKVANQYQAGDWGAIGGVRALPVAGTSAYTISGGGAQSGMDITIDGTGASHFVRYLGADGRFLGGSSADTANMTALIAAMGTMIPITQIRHDTVAVVR